jgi:sugar/nucleoside kinase (ribokinase family)
MEPRVLLFDGHEPEASLEALTRFPGALSILDAGSWRDGTALLAGRVQYLVASERFAAQATGRNPGHEERAHRECVRDLRARFPSATVAVTLGERGVAALSETGFEHVAAFPATEVVDTTGAGDIFHGAFAYALAVGMDFSRALRFSSAAAALSVCRLGGRGSIPALKEVLEVFPDAH